MTSSGGGGNLNISAGRRAIQAATGGQRVDPGLAEPGSWREGVETSPLDPNKPVRMITKEVGGEIVTVPHASREVSPLVEDDAIQEFLGGTLPPAEVERRYGLRAGYLGRALRRRYTDLPTLKRALQGSLHESALVMAEHAMLHVEEMTAGQAILGAKIAIDAASTLEKGMRDAPKTIDFGTLSSIGAGLARLSAMVSATELTEENAGGLVRRSVVDEDEISPY